MRPGPYFTHHDEPQRATDVLGPHVVFRCSAASRWPQIAPAQDCPFPALVQSDHQSETSLSASRRAWPPVYP